MAFTRNKRNHKHLISDLLVTVENLTTGSSSVTKTFTDGFLKYEIESYPNLPTVFLLYAMTSYESKIKRTATKLEMKKERRNRYLLTYQSTNEAHFETINCSESINADGIIKSCQSEGESSNLLLDITQILSVKSKKIRYQNKGDVNIRIRNTNIIKASKLSLKTTNEINYNVLTHDLSEIINCVLTGASSITRNHNNDGIITYIIKGHPKQPIVHIIYGLSSKGRSRKNSTSISDLELKGKEETCHSRQLPFILERKSSTTKKEDDNKMMTDESCIRSAHDGENGREQTVLFQNNVKNTSGPNPFKKNFKNRNLERDKNTFQKIGESVSSGGKCLESNSLGGYFRKKIKNKGVEGASIDIFNTNLSKKGFKHLNSNRNEILFHKPTKKITRGIITCEKSFEPRATKKNQVGFDLNASRFYCSYCKKTFKTKTQKRSHEIIHVGKKQYQCGYCEKTFAYISSKDIHEKVHNGEKPYPCNYCNKTFSHKSYLKCHERIHTGEKPYNCMYCNKTFNQKCNLKCHERYHTGEKPYKCNYCDKAYAQKINLTYHERFHTGERPYSCIYCNKTFSILDKLTCHERLHTGEKPYNCNYCNKAFRTRSSLMSHERLHTGEKPYNCKYCDKDFRHKSSLTFHERHHTGDTTYNCNDWNKTLRTTYVTTRERLHTRDKSYRCSYCDKIFSRKYSLMRHEKIHTGKIHYNCNYCDKTFKLKHNLNSHERVHHWAETL